MTVAFTLGALAAGVAYSRAVPAPGRGHPQRRRRRADLRADLGVARRWPGPRRAGAERPAVVARGRPAGAGRLRRAARPRVGRRLRDRR